MTFGDRRKTVMAAVAAALVLALPGVASAGDSEQLADGATTTTLVPEQPITPALVTLLVPGTGLTVTINRGDDGVIESVGLDPATGATIVKERDHKVVFLLGDGDTQVVVKSRDGLVRTKVKADATADVTGPGSWSADVFGTGLVTIPYNVTFAGNVPTITIDPGAITFPSGVTVEVGEPTSRTAEDGHKSSFKIKVRLATEEDRVKVSFVAKTHLNDDGSLMVALSVTMSERHRHKWDRDDDDHDRSGNWDDGDQGDDRRGDRNDDRDGDHEGDHDGSEGGGDGGGDA